MIHRGGDQISRWRGECWGGNRGGRSRRGWRRLLDIWMRGKKGSCDWLGVEESRSLLWADCVVYFIEMVRELSCAELRNLSFAVSRRRESQQGRKRHESIQGRDAQEKQKTNYQVAKRIDIFTAEPSHPKTKYWQSYSAVPLKSRT